MTTQEFILAVDEKYRINRFSGQRVGQAVFNAVHTVRPDIADKYRATSVDPFHHDEKGIDFLSRCVEDHAEWVFQDEASHRP